ncbi:MAG: N-acetylmuramoyl-L-alanine amidase, partial [Treponema sp.]|nr:N-acetylmuramoyl-L-alanine amidase [Treponema sp.]
MVDNIKTRPLKPALILLLILLPQFRPVFVQAGNSVNGLQQGVGREADSSLPGDFEGEDGAAYGDDGEAYAAADDDESDIEENLLPPLDGPAPSANAAPPAPAGAKPGSGLQSGSGAAPGSGAKSGNGLQQGLHSPGQMERAEGALSLDEAMSNLGAGPAFYWDPLFRTGNISLSGHHASFSAGYPGEQLPVIFDSREILTLSAPWLENGLLRFPESFVTALKRAFDNSILNEQFRYRIAAIVVDPGHGGKDPGAQGTHTINGKTLKLSEKDITLRSSLYLYSRLKAAYPDKRVLLTRDRDTYPTLEERVLLANSVPLKDNEAILYVSIHANASMNRHARGYEVWYLSPDYRRDLIDREKFRDSAEIIPIINDMLQEEFTNESIMIAQAINRRIGEAMGRSLPARGLKAEEWFVVRNARMPSVLVELGFITNPADAEILNSEESLKKLTEAIYKG